MSWNYELKLLVPGERERERERERGVCERGRRRVNRDGQTNIDRGRWNAHTLPEHTPTVRHTNNAQRKLGSL